MSPTRQHDHTTRRSEGPGRAPAAEGVATASHPPDGHRWSGSTRLLKQTTQIAQLKTPVPAGLRQGPGQEKQPPHETSGLGRGDVVQRAWHWNAGFGWWEEDEGFVYDPTKGEWHMDQDLDNDEEPEFDDDAITAFKIDLLNTMATDQVLAYFAGHSDDVDMVREYLQSQQDARLGNNDIDALDDDEMLFLEDELEDDELFAPYEDDGGVPVATSAQQGESVNSGGASTCVIVFLRATTSSGRRLIGASHLNANDLQSMDAVRQSLTDLREEVSAQLDTPAQETITSEQAYSIGGQDSDDTDDLLDYVRLSLALKELGPLVEWRGSVMPATDVGSNSSVDARMESNSIEYSIQTKAKSDSSAEDPPVQMARSKASLASGKAGRRADQQRREDQGRHEARRQPPPEFDPGVIGHAPMGNVGVMLTLMMLLGQMHGAHAQQTRQPSPRPSALPSPGQQPSLSGNATALATPWPRQTPSLHDAPPNATHLATPPLLAQPEIPRVDAPGNTTRPHALIAPPHALRATTPTAPNITATATASEQPPKVPQQPPRETSIDPSGKVTFATDEVRRKYESTKGRGAVEAVAIKNLMASTQTGGGILDELHAHDVDPVIVRTDLGRGVGGEADIGNDRYVTVNSRQDLRRNTIVAAHELRHREQFASGMLDEKADPYRKAYAEVEAKNVGLDVYAELKARGYFDEDVKDVDSEKLDLKDRTADRTQYARTIFNIYLSRYRGDKADQYPDFASDAALDQHIADQQAYFAARRLASHVELEISRLGLNPDDTKNLPPDLKDRLQQARADARRAKRVADRSHP